MELNPSMPPVPSMESFVTNPYAANNQSTTVPAHVAEDEIHLPITRQIYNTLARPPGLEANDPPSTASVLDDTSGLPNPQRSSCIPLTHYFSRWLWREPCSLSSAALTAKSPYSWSRKLRTQLGSTEAPNTLHGETP
jgi:hypothetical protein